MDAHIEYKEEMTPPFREEIYKNFIGQTKTRKVSQESKTVYNVYLYLTPSEEERATIQKFRLGEVIIYEERRYTKEEIEEAARKAAEHARRFAEKALNMQAADNDPDEVQRDHWARELDHRKDAKIPVTVEEYFDHPYIRTFLNPREARIYMDELQSEILPKLKETISGYANAPDKVSFSL